jgi:hypothetical protein
MIYTGNPKVNPKYGFRFDIYNQDFLFFPKSFFEKGVVKDDKQYYSLGAIQPGFDEAFAPYARTFSIDEISKIVQKDFAEDYEKSGFTDKEGYLLPKDFVQTYVNPRERKANEVMSDGFVYGQITGLATTPEGQKYYTVSASGKPGATAYLAQDDMAYGNYVIPGDKKKWYESPLGIASGLLLIGSGLGMAGIGPLASGGAAAGSAAGIVGTPGVSTIFPVAAPIAPTVTAISPMTAAGAAGGFGLLEGAAFPSQGLSVPAINSAEVALLPQGTAVAGQGLQIPTLPGLSAMGGGTGLAVGVPGGTVTQLGMVPTGATPVLGDPKSFINNPDVLGKTVFSTDYLAAPGAAASGISASDALRLANQARGLLGAGQNPIVPQQGLPQGGGGAQGVDYSGLLSLLQMQAKTPGVSSLTTPAQLRQMYQPTLLPNVLSLLG